VAEKPAANGYCTNTTPVPGTIRTVNAKNTGPKFLHLHGRVTAQARAARKCP
jgi:hypothetical protein